MTSDTHQIETLARSGAGYHISGTPEDDESEIIADIDEWWDAHSLAEEHHALSNAESLGEPETHFPGSAAMDVYCRGFRRLRNRLRERAAARDPEKLT